MLTRAGNGELFSRRQLTVHFRGRSRHACYRSVIPQAITVTTVL